MPIFGPHIFGSEIRVSLCSGVQLITVIRMDRLNLLLLLTFLGAEANILHNGDFQSGTVAPWRCIGCHCDSSHKYLGGNSDFEKIQNKYNIFPIYSG